MKMLKPRLKPKSVSTDHASVEGNRDHRQQMLAQSMLLGEENVVGIWLSFSSQVAQSSSNCHGIRSCRCFVSTSWQSQWCGRHFERLAREARVEWTRLNLVAAEAADRNRPSAVSG